jgi:hypothetical protein
MMAGGILLRIVVMVAIIGLLMLTMMNKNLYYSTTVVPSRKNKHYVRPIILNFNHSE